ncbi:hypothetical protein OV203_19390 [Nannocystis sp. ILAH1]|uniref:hypothetical protein n=1 Tax=unclassified Nannocystis TaxID=2627009 RepID=UPI0022702D30|nr:MULTISPECIES: hypothetical protein [unclassified Nannocystis]MCY0989312.1 hypothetical protein [Nannocystis sp. ILAH1]MCY1064993.1 hypothetical protein [Nannocystis sp. RBIL2]
MPIPPVSVRTNSASGSKFRPGRLVGTLFMIGVFGATAYVAGAARPGLFVTEVVTVQNHTSLPDPPSPAPPVEVAPRPPIDPPQPRTGDVVIPAPLPQPAAPTATPSPPAALKKSTRRTPRKKSRPLPAIDVERVSGTHGLGTIDIRVAVDPLRPQLRQCHASALDHGLLATVQVTAKLTVRGAAVESVAPVTSPPSSNLWRCIRGVLQQATFKTAPQYAEVTIELRLGPPNRHE